MNAPPELTAPRRDSQGVRRLSGGVFATDALAFALTASADAALLIERRGDTPLVTWANGAASELFTNPFTDRPPLLPLLAGGGDDIALRRLISAFDAGVSTRLECPVPSTAGVHWGDWTLSPIISDEDAPRWLITVRDITARQRRDQAIEIYLRETEQARTEAQEQARQAEALVSELTMARGQAQEVMHHRSAFLASVSHEIRTPLNGVIGMTGVLMGTPLSHEQREIAGAVRSSAERLLGLLNDVLDFAKMDGGRMQLEAVEFDVHETIEQIVELLAVRPGAGRLRVNTLIAPGVPTLMCGDPGRFGQVLSNLVGNAVKFTPEGQVTVRASVDAVDDAHVTLRCEVSDSGIGIAPDAVHRLFQPFVQADPSTTRRFGGSGLGLAICKELVHLMGGNIGVRSAPGEGSVFWFTVRLAASTSAPSRNSAEHALLVGQRALIIDPSAEDRAIFALQLSGCGLQSQGADSLADACRQLTLGAQTGQPFTFVFVHHECVDAAPLQAARIARDAGRAAGHTPAVVLLVPLGASPPQSALDDAGAAGLVHTPVRPSQLSRELVAALGRLNPATVTDDTQTMLDDTDVHGPRWHQAPRVLVAEDNVINQQVAQHLLLMLGCRVDVVANGLEALDALSQVPYDLVFMDCQMPECDGYEATRRLRRAGTARSSIPVVAMTANAMPGDRQRCLDAGMDDYVAKPVHQEEIDAVLRRWLAQHLDDAQQQDWAPPVSSAVPAPTAASESASVAEQEPAQVSTFEIGPAAEPPAAPTSAGVTMAMAVADAMATPTPRISQAIAAIVGGIDERIVASLKAMQARGSRTTLIAELLQAFRAQATDVDQQLRAALSAQDTKRVREVAHKFKGACASIGACDLAASARMLEEAAREGRVSDLEPAASDVVAAIPAAIAALDDAYADAMPAA